MSVTVKGMRMPKNCSECDFLKPDKEGEYCARSGKYVGNLYGRREDCPLEPPHPTRFDQFHYATIEELAEMLRKLVWWNPPKEQMMEWLRGTAEEGDR